MSNKSDFNIDPIPVPEIWKEKTKWEKRWEKIPFVGWFFVTLIENGRFCRARGELYEQIKNRPTVTLRQFYRDKEKITLQVATIIMYEMNWATNIFSQDDLLDVLIFDGDLFYRICDKIEVLFDIPEQCLSKCYDDNPNMKFGDFIQCIIQNMGTR
ncbi:MAG: hypothetical protein LBH59_02625 [Planctomycetaceae bacterium]|jgi:hypothetical protein|nr:hypothetical protein [Planctomycetaceae bacterium]